MASRQHWVSRRRGWIVARGAMILAVLSVLLPSATAEAANCGTTQASNYHAGYTGPGTIPNQYNQGISADILLRPGYFCPTDLTANNFVNSYLMLKDGTCDPLPPPGGCEQGPFDGHAQVGFEQDPVNGRRHFGQSWSGAADDVDTRYSVGHPAAGDWYHYEVKFVAACSCLRMYVNTTIWISTDWNPFLVWGDPWGFEAISEGRYKEDDIPGSQTAGPTLYSDVKLVAYSGTYYALPYGTTNFNNNPTRWRAASTASDELRTYTLN